MKKITGVGFSIPSEDQEFISIDSISSLSETDIAVFSPDFNLTEYVSTSDYEGKKLYNKESSAKIIEHSNHWKNELLHFVKRGGTLFLVLCKKEDFYVYTGTKDISGTGRNQKTTEHVTPFSNYNCLPFPKIEYCSAYGKTVYANSMVVANLHKSFKEYFNFETYIKSDSITNSTFTTKNKDRILGASLKLEKGYILFIPNINLDIDKFAKYNSKKDETYWTAEGIKVGHIFENCLVQIDIALRKSTEKTPKPEWINNEQFLLKESEKTKAVIEKNLKEIVKRQKENESLYVVIEEQESLKDLLYETGKPLENAVIEALRILEYKAENYDDGELELDQIITSPEGQRYIGECEGKDNKDIDVSKFRQLLDGLNADFEKSEIEEKAFGLLFGNPQRLIEPKERTLSFTNKCQLGAKREGIGLIKTEDLFRVCRYISENKDKAFASKCRKAIFDQLGKIIEFPNP